MTGEGRAPVEVLKVSATSKPVAVAGAIAGVIRSKGRVEVQAIGAGAINGVVYIRRGHRPKPHCRETEGIHLDRVLIVIDEQHDGWGGDH